MKWVLTTPEIDIQPRDSSSTIIAYVVRSSPIPPYSSGIVTPNSPSSFICSTIGVGNDLLVGELAHHLGDRALFVGLLEQLCCCGHGAKGYIGSPMRNPRDF